jgi:GNAT superfamily N-acetyltransferase
MISFDKWMRLKSVIINSFSDKEKEMYGNGSFDKQEYNATAFYKILYDKELPIAYMNCTDSGKLGLAKGDVNLSFAVHKDYRGQGLAKKLIKEAVHWFKGSKYQTMTWIMD